jgi:3-dehydroquinate dehydratase-2
MKILVINGPNINMLGIREPGIYGRNTFADLLALLEETAQAENITVHQYQSNHEGALVDKIQEAYGVYDGIVINPAAYTHTSVAILDALKSVSIPAVEVHISDVDARESFRQISYAGMACVKTIKGHGLEGYREAILYLKETL